MQHEDLNCFESLTGLHRLAYIGKDSLQYPSPSFHTSGATDTYRSAQISVVHHKTRVPTLHDDEDESSEERC